MWLGEAQELFKQNIFQRRLKVIGYLVITCYSVIGLKLFGLQVLEGEEMVKMAERNRLQLIFLRPARGKIMDHNNVPLIQSGPSFTLFYSPASSPSKNAQQEVEDYLAHLFPSARQRIIRKLGEARRVRQFVRVFEDLPRSVAFGLIEDSRCLPGVSVSVEAKRRYSPHYSAPHVLGTLGEVGREEVAQGFHAEFRPGDLVGRSGLEKVYDGFLRGQTGGLEIEVDSVGRQVHLIRRVEPVGGDDLVLTLDSSIQKAAEDALAGSVTGRGAVVVLDPQSGAILALASAPGFEAGSLAESINDERHPLFNRAVQGMYPWGSGFKMITTLVGLESGAVKPFTRFFCNGTYPLGPKVFHCWKAHGWNDLFGAVAWSCDVYFYQVARLIRAEDLENAAHQFGLGQATHIDLPGEVPGLVPGPERSARLGKSWFEGDTLNLAIGQGQLMVTPLQAAVAMGAVASHGLVFKPYLVSEVRGPRGNLVFLGKPRLVRKIGFSGNSWKALEAALKKVVDEGTGQQAKIPGWVVYGKTGTAQNPQGDDHAWFLCALQRPPEPPKLVVAALVENGGHGGTVAVPVARRVMEAALGLIPETPHE